MLPVSQLIRLMGLSFGILYVAVQLVVEKNRLDDSEKSRSAYMIVHKIVDNFPVIRVFRLEMVRPKV